MVKQGDIIWLDFNPTLGSEQKGIRPALVVSNNTYNKKSKHFALVVPITSTKSNYPLHVNLEANSTIKGQIMCEQVKMIDLKARSYKQVETISSVTLDKVVKIIKLMF
jgi:mRNA interferase MazF